MSKHRPSRLTEEIRRQLRYVICPAAPVDLTWFPDFMVIGPQRTGTSWIHECLRWHPEIRWPRHRELYFFSRLSKPDMTKFVSANLVWYRSQFQETADQLAERERQAQARYQRAYEPHLTAEGSSSYAAMEPALIDEIVALNPSIRAILMVRDPLERAWSHAKKDLLRNRGKRLDEVDEATFREFVQRPHQLRCAQYRHIIARWSERLMPGHLFVGRFTDLHDRPAALLRAILTFVGVAVDDRVIQRQARQVANPTSPIPIPSGYRRHLEAVLAREIGDDWQSLGARLDG